MKEEKKPVSHAAVVDLVAVWLLLATLGGVLAFRISQEFGT